MLADITIRNAHQEDLLAIVTLINQGGPTGTPREVLPRILPANYHDAFMRITQDSNAYLMVAENEGRVVGTFQLNYLMCLAGKGREDAQLEAVHVDAEFRDKGIGSQMMKWAIDHATARNCRRLQLTTDKRRKRAHSFYEKLGFVATHEGMKMVIGDST